MNLLKRAKSYLAKEQFEIFREIILSIVISSVISTSFGFYFNKRIDERIAQREFTYEFGKTFSDNTKYRNVRLAIEDQYLHNATDRATLIDDYDIDDYLGLLSNMWGYYKDGFITEELLKDQYEYYLCITYNSQLTNEFLTRLKKQGFSQESSYPFLEEMAIQLKLKNKNCRDI